MKRTMILAAAVLALAVILCLTGTAAVDRAVDEAEELRQTAENAARTGDLTAAIRSAQALRDHWDDRGKVLELITSHDALSDVRGALTDALLCLEHGEIEEFFRASAAAGVALERIRVTEAVRWGNLY